MKKLISLLLTLALTLTVFGTVAMAEDLSKTVTAASTDNPMEMLWVTQDATTGEQTISTKEWPLSSNSATQPNMGSNQWALMKIEVGDSMLFETMSFQGRFQWTSGTVLMNVAPLSYTDYEAAVAAKASGETLTSLVQPLEGEANVVSKSNSRSSNGMSSIKATLTADLFNNSEYYKDGCVYLAFSAVGGTSSLARVALRPNQISYWTLATTYTVTDFSDSVITWNDGAYTVTTTTTSGTAMLIAASFNGTTMVDAKVATVDAATAVDGVISGTITGLAAGSTVTLFLWDSVTLTPAISVTETN